MAQKQSRFKQRRNFKSSRKGKGKVHRRKIGMGKGLQKGIPRIDIQDGLFPPTILTKLKSEVFCYGNAGEPQSTVFIQANNLVTPYNALANYGTIGTDFANDNSTVTNHTAGFAVNTYYPANYHLLFGNQLYQGYRVLGVSIEIDAISPNTGDEYGLYIRCNTLGYVPTGPPNWNEVINDPKAKRFVIGVSTLKKPIRCYFPLHEYYGISRLELLAGNDFLTQYAQTLATQTAYPLAIGIHQYTMDGGNLQNNAGYLLKTTWYLQAEGFEGANPSTD